MNPKDLRGFTVRHMAHIRETKDDISYVDYLFKYELTPIEKETYYPYLSPFIRKRNLIARLLRTTNLSLVARNMRKQINAGHLPEQYRLFLREYYPQSKATD